MNTINYHNRIFKALSNSVNGEIDSCTIFRYKQHDNVVYGDYSGGQIIKGQLIANVLENGDLDMRYHHINADQSLKIGKCYSRPKVEKDGSLTIEEDWQWLCDDFSEGKSQLVEVREA